MRHVGVREFRDKATAYLSGNEILTVEKHGQPIGFYIPVLRASQKERQAALVQFNVAVERFLKESGLSEDELADRLNLNKPFDASGR